MVEALSSLTDSAGEKAFKKGQKAISTSLFKWSADYLEGSISFEKAAKSFAVSGLEARAKEAWLMYADCCEKNSEMNGAAEGFQEAAFLSTDHEQSMSLLHKADEYYKIGGYPDRGLSQIKRFAKMLLEKETEKDIQKAMEIYENTLMVQVYEGENYLLNTDIPESYLRIQMERKDYSGALRTKKRFIDYLHRTNTQDHQVRRSWLEVVCLQILMEDFYRLEDSLDSFMNEQGQRNMYSQDEFQVASELKEHISAKEFEKLTQTLRKPIFGFIEIEIVKALKRWATNPPENVRKMAPLVDGGMPAGEAEIHHPVTKEAALDDLLL